MDQNPAQSAQQDDGATKRVRYYVELEASAKKMKKKNNPFGSTKSRKARYKHLRKPVRTSKAVYHANSMRTTLMKDIKRLPASGEITDLTGLDSDAEVEAATTVSIEHVPSATGQVMLADSSTFWPDGSRKVAECENPEHLQFPDYGDLDPCKCLRDCFQDACSNAEAGAYCTPASCACDGICWNSPHVLRGLELVETDFGYGVRATEFIPNGCMIGEYSGVLTTHDFDKDKETTSEYALRLQMKSSRSTVYIDAKDCGGQTRFINHSCSPNSIFAECRCRRTIKVLVFTTKPIRAGEDVTVSCGDEL